MTPAEKIQIREALTVKDASLVFGKAESFVEDLIDKGELGFVVLGTKRAIPRFEINNWMMRNLKTIRKAV